MVTATELLTTRFDWIIEIIKRAVGAAHGKNADKGAFLILLWKRLNRLSRRFAALVEKVKSGTPPTSRAEAPKRTGTKRARTKRVGPATRGQLDAKALRVTSRKAWLLKYAQPTAVAGTSLQMFLEQENVKELIDQAPMEMGRLLRPLCRMLDVAVPAALKLPVRERPRRPAREAPRQEMPVRRPMSAKWPRVASAHWPKGVVLPGEALPLRKRNRRRARRQE